MAKAAPRKDTPVADVIGASVPVWVLGGGLIGGNLDPSPQHYGALAGLILGLVAWALLVTIVVWGIPLRRVARLIFRILRFGFRASRAGYRLVSNKGERHDTTHAHP